MATLWTTLPEASQSSYELIEHGCKKGCSRRVDVLRHLTSLLPPVPVQDCYCCYMQMFWFCGFCVPKFKIFNHLGTKLQYILFTKIEYFME